eukprot:jgi/Bigna1/79367/fgenesh1_pg.61_\
MGVLGPAAARPTGRASDAQSTKERRGKIRNGANPNRSSSSSSGSRGKKGDRLMALKAQIKEARREAAMWKDRNRDMEAFLQCQRALAEERREQEAAKKRKI